jgi:hypothetical protein
VGDDGVGQASTGKIMMNKALREKPTEQTLSHSMREMQLNNVVVDFIWR